MSVARVEAAQLLPPIQLIEKPPIGEVVKLVALRIFKEMALAILFSATVAYFVATPSGLTFIMSALVVQLTVSIFFHSLGAFASYKAIDGNPICRKVATACEWITGCNFGGFTGFNTQILVHEFGHAFASLLIYKRPRPSIEVYPFVGGLTQFFKTGLTPFGQKLGPALSTCFVVASGPGLTLFISSALLAIGIGLLETYPEFGKYLITWSAIDFLHHAFYAYTALGAAQWNLSHDFVHLSIFGLHPGVATIGILAIPILISVGMYWKSST